MTSSTQMGGACRRGFFIKVEVPGQRADHSALVAWLDDEKYESNLQPIMIISKGWLDYRVNAFLPPKKLAQAGQEGETQ